DRERLYELSPALRSIQKTLDSEGFSSPGCTAANGEVSIHYAAWLLRQGASNEGHHESPAKARAFYRRVAQEVNAACDRGAIDGGPPRSREFPVFHPSLRRMFVENCWTNFTDLWRLAFPSCLTGPASRDRATGKTASVYERILLEPARPRFDRRAVLTYD